MFLNNFKKSVFLFFLILTSSVFFSSPFSFFSKKPSPPVSDSLSASSVVNSDSLPVSNVNQLTGEIKKLVSTVVKLKLDVDNKFKILDKRLADLDKAFKEDKTLLPKKFNEIDSKLSSLDKISKENNDYTDKKHMILLTHLDNLGKNDQKDWNNKFNLIDNKINSWDKLFKDGKEYTSKQFSSVDVKLNALNNVLKSKAPVQKINQKNTKEENVKDLAKNEVNEKVKEEVRKQLNLFRGTSFNSTQTVASQRKQKKRKKLLRYLLEEE